MLAFSFISTSNPPLIAPAATLRVVAVKSPSNSIAPVESVKVTVVAPTLPVKIVPPDCVIVNVEIPDISNADVIRPLPALSPKELLPPIIIPSRSILPAPAPVVIVESAVNVIPAVAEPKFTTLLVVIISPAIFIASASYPPAPA